MRELDISGNHLQAIPGNSFRPLIHLETLRIGNNQIFEITYADFRSLENLESFLMDGCYRDRDLRIASDSFKENANKEIRSADIPSNCDRLPLPIFDLMWILQVDFRWLHAMFEKSH